MMKEMVLKRQQQLKENNMIKNYSSLSSKSELNKILKEMSELLDISTSQYEDAISKYKAVATYLSNDDNIDELEPDMYPQGSFALGTIIKPLSDKEEYDIDLVCELKKGSSKKLSQYDLKTLIGDRLKSGIYRDKLKELNGGRRCWTIEYAEDTQLHLDILPAIPDSNSRLILASTGNAFSNSAISITDKKEDNYYQITDDWVKSNPRGYKKWFNEQMVLQLNESKKMFAESINASVEDVPDYKVKTPLQRAIQLLKRHRDSTCEDNDDKPISIIITTLGAKAYGNEDNLYDALISILTKMTEHIEYKFKDGKRVAVIKNPVDSRENFADKWEEHPIREKVFMKWHEEAKKYFGMLLGLDNDLITLNESLNKGFGENLVKRTFSKLGNQNKSYRDSGNLRMDTNTGILSTSLAIGSSKKVKKHNFYGVHKKK